MDSQPIAAAYQFCPHCSAPNPSPGTVPFKCRECGFASFFGPVAAVGGLVVNAQQELLLVRRARDPGRGKWGLPGGFVDPGETAEGALLRELVEETNLQVIETRYLTSHPNHYNYHGVVAPVIDFFYVCQVRSHDQVSLARDELEHFEWARPTPEYLDEMAFESNRRAIEYWHSLANDS